MIIRIIKIKVFFFFIVVGVMFIFFLIFKEKWRWDQLVGNVIWLQRLGCELERRETLQFFRGEREIENLRGWKRDMLLLLRSFVGMVYFFYELHGFTSWRLQMKFR
jgi:hypothetical protein